MQASPAPPSSRRRRKSSDKPPLPEAEEATLDSAATARYERLRVVRLELARAQEQPAFCVAHDSVLREIARAAPKNLPALARIRGIGESKLEKFGAAFLEAVKG
jgi:ATP-dependent DNA helicase RecQ